MKCRMKEIGRTDPSGKKRARSNKQTDNHAPLARNAGLRHAGKTMNVKKVDRKTQKDTKWMLRLSDTYIRFLR